MKSRSVRCLLSRHRKTRSRAGRKQTVLCLPGKQRPGAAEHGRYGVY